MVDSFLVFIQNEKKYIETLLSPMDAMHTLSFGHPHLLSKAGVGNLWGAGKLRPPPCFCKNHQLLEHDHVHLFPSGDSVLRQTQLWGFKTDSICYLALHGRKFSVDKC